MARERSGVKNFTRYLESALKLEQMAIEEQEEHLKKALAKLAATYRDLATERASKPGLPMPPFELDARD